MNPPFHPSPISPKKSVNPARMEANLAKNAATNQGRRDVHPGKRDAHPDKRDAQPDKRDTQPDRRDAHPDRRDAHPERRDAHPDRRDAHPDRRGPTQKATIPVRTGTNLAEVDVNPLDGNQTQKSLSTAQKGADTQPEEAGLDQTGGSTPSHGIVANKGTMKLFCSFND